MDTKDTKEIFKKMAHSRQRLLGVAAALLFSGPAPAQQQPTFQAGTDVIAVDVSVVDGRGQPLRDLTPADFTVRIDGQPRRIVSAEWIPLAARQMPRTEARVPDGYVSNEDAAGGRLIVLAVDQPSIPFNAMRPVQDALFRFIDGLEPTDMLALVGFGQAAPSVPFVSDRDRIKQALARMPGQQAAETGSHNVGLSTALGFERSMTSNQDDRCAPRCADPLLEILVNRDCPAYSASNPEARRLCKAEILSEAAGAVQSARQNGEITIRALQRLLTALKNIEAPKTLILVSQRFFMDADRDANSRVSEIGELAAAARTSIYGVRLEEDQLNIAQGLPSPAPTQDREAVQQGLQALTSAARGALFNVSGTGTGIFDRIAAEISGYYLIGIEPSAGDRDGSRHGIEVAVSRRGTTVRSRRTMLAGDTPDALRRTPRDAATAALAEPFLLTRLPLRAAAFTLGGADASRLQVLIHVEIGSGYTAPARVAVAYGVFDADGRAIDGEATDARLAPAAAGVQSALEYRATAGVGPGTYTVKFAAADGDRVGSVQVPIRAALIDLGDVKVTELMAGGPVPPGDLLRPSIGSRIAFGAVQGYLEAYGDAAASLAVTFEVARNDDGAAMLSENVRARPAGGSRALFSQLIPVRALPPGEYRLRAVIRKGDAVMKTLVRSFVISASTGGPALAAATAGDLAIPVDAKDLKPAFRREAVLRPETLAPLRSHVSAAARSAFDQGISQLERLQYADAETSFRRALQQDAESTTPLVYLAACLAAAGYDAQASAAWQTALARGSNQPEIYEWLGESLMRDRMLKDALDIFEDAVQQFPNDPRFFRPLALLYATSGRGRDAVKTMRRFLEAVPGDARGTWLALQWLFNLHRAGLVAEGRAEDAALAREYAARYAKTASPDQALVKQWVEFLEREEK